MNYEQIIIYNKLIHLHNTNNIANIILYGDTKCGKKTILENFLLELYKTKEIFEKYIILLNCSHGKGNIKFIRESIKYFANTVIDKKDNVKYKSVVLINADKLTCDAQSALRRCIEIYNHSTRFFIVIDSKYNIMKPILSRFSQIHVYNKTQYSLTNLSNNFTKHYNSYYNKIKSILEKIVIDNDIYINLIQLTDYLYLNGFSANMIKDYIIKNTLNNLNKYKFILSYNKFKLQIRNEKILILFLLEYYYLKSVIN